jgi:hypothetical protein
MNDELAQATNLSKPRLHWHLGWHEMYQVRPTPQPAGPTPSPAEEVVRFSTVEASEQSLPSTARERPVPPVCGDGDRPSRRVRRPRQAAERRQKAVLGRDQLAAELPQVQQGEGSKGMSKKQGMRRRSFFGLLLAPLAALFRRKQQPMARTSWRCIPIDDGKGGYLVPEDVADSYEREQGNE